MDTENGARDVSTEIAWRNFCEAMAEAEMEFGRVMSRREIIQHVLVIGTLLVAIAVKIWLSYFGPLS
jgi:hypothetical protein